MADKWYDSDIVPLIAGAIMAVGIITAYLVLGSNYSYKKLENTQTIQQRNLNVNPLPETYVEINGVKYFSAIDGNSLEKDLLK